MQTLNISHSLELYDEACRLMPWGSQTASKKPEQFAFGAFPIYIDHGSGARVTDVDGNVFIDYILGLGPITLGYCYPQVDQAVQRQLQKGAVFGLLSPLEVEAARAVTQVVPCAEQVRFLKTGAEATSAALRVARAHTGKDVILHCGYHGWLDTVMGAVPSPGIPALMRQLIIPFEWRNEAQVRELVATHAANLAGIITTPVTYDAVEGPQFLQFLRQVCDEAGVPLIYDEIVTGYRMAPGGAQEFFGVIPDMACFAKGIANGFPLAALAGRRKVMETMEQTVISSTYGGEALSLAAVVACHEVYRQHDVAAFLQRQGQRLMDGLNEAAEANGVQAKWSGYPCMSSYRFLYDDASTNRHCTTFWLQECARRGVLFRRGGLNFITFSHDDEIIGETLRVGTEVLRVLAETIRHGKLEDAVAGAATAGGRYER